MKGALDGVTVLDFTAMIAGPYCTRLMADAGAEVLKIEPLEGDYIRTRAPIRAGESVYFGVLNAGKQSVALNLKKPEGVELAKQLAAASDVVVENFRPGVAKRLGFDYTALSAINPRLVYCSISGYGQTGKYASLPAYAPIVHAASGFDIANMSYQGAERPMKSAIFVADYLTGVHAFGAICAALVRCSRNPDDTDKGEYIDCALMDAMVGMLGYEVAEAQGPASGPRPLYQAVRTLDGFLMVAPISQGNFEDMADAIDRADLKSDPRFALPAARSTNWQALMDEADRWASDKTLDQAESIMVAFGVPHARYQSARDVLSSEYALERGLFATVGSGSAEICVTNPPFRMEGVGTAGRVPALGEHGRSVLERVLGRGPADIEQLIREGVLGRADNSENAEE